MREKPASGMAWAVDGRSNRPVYVGTLAANQTGLQCGCICPACNARLQAVNAGQDASSSRTPFFRHHLTEQGPGCKFRVAELAALKLLAESGLIEIPAPRGVSAYAGRSGRIYNVEQRGEAVREAIIECRLVSAVQALLTLESGREVVLVLRGHQDVGEFGSVLAVIEIQVSDPEVALLSPEEIVARSELRGQWMHLVRHQDDERLRQSADDEARAQALEQLDIHPDELDLPVGATRKQASESMLHWAIKDALLGLGYLMAPEYRQSVTVRGNDGSLHTVGVVIPATRLVTTEVVDEVLFDGYRPDIVCVATADDGPLGRFRLLVEVAVTSKVTATKLDLIGRDAVACIELDVGRFGEGGQVSRSRLRELVARDLQCKTWLHHPLMAQMLSDAMAKANAARDAADAQRAAAVVAAREQDRVERARLQHQQREDERKQAWAQSLDWVDAARELRLVLDRRWAAELQLSSNGMVWQDSEFEEAIGGVLKASHLSRWITAHGGIAWRLSQIVGAATDQLDGLDFHDVSGALGGFARWDLEKWLGLIHLAIDHLQPKILPDTLTAHANQRVRVLESLRAGQRTHVRPGDLDDILMAMFPELQAVLSQELGTRAYCERLQREQEAAERAVREAAAAAAALAAAEQAQRDAEAAAVRERERLPQAIASLGYEMLWRSNLKLPPSPEDAVKYLHIMGDRNPSPETVDLVTDGWAARQRGCTFSEWLASRVFGSVEEVNTARKSLEKAFLIQSKISASSKR